MPAEWNSGASIVYADLYTKNNFDFVSARIFMFHKHILVVVAMILISNSLMKTPVLNIGQ